MTTLECSRNVAIIADLHEQIMGNARKSLDLAIRAGGLLMEQRNTVEHGQWESWVRAHFSFTPRTASNYMRIYRERDQIKSANVSDLADAYELLVEPAAMDRHEAEGLAARIRDDLYHLAETVIPFIEKLRGIRDDEIFAPNYPTFETFLLDLGITQDEFQARDGLCDALQAWQAGGSAEEIVNILMARAA